MNNEQNKSGQDLTNNIKKAIDRAIEDNEYITYADVIASLEFVKFNFLTEALKKEKE